jgi:hypothetical protein
VLLLAAGCSRPESSDVEVRVRHVALDPVTRSLVVLLEDPTRNVALPIWIGPAEAQAIALHIDGEPPARPLTHDLMKTVLDRLGVTLRRVVIRDLHEETYLADIVIDQDGAEVAIDSRPSDAIALAVRFGQPIFVRRVLFAREAVVDLRGTGSDTETVEGVTVQALSAELSRHFDLPEDAGGVLVAEAASQAPLRRGDVILEIDGEPVSDPADFRAKLRAAGGRASVRVQRDGVRVQLSLHGAAPARD